MFVNYNNTELALKLVGMSQKCNVKFWLPMRSAKRENHATFIKKSKQHFLDFFFHFGESTSLLLGFFVKKMSFKNKSKYFHIMQAKKRKKQESIITANEIELPKTEKKKQVSIACFFQKPEKPLKNVECRKSKDSDETVKRKLEEFKASNQTESNHDDLASSENTTSKKRRIELDLQDLEEIPADKNGETKAIKETKKLTPLEQQVKDLQSKHPDTLLMVECGYRYRFFGEDAVKAAKVLDIIAHPDSVGSGLLGLTASVPTFNGHSNYVRKLVLTGEKVGIVAQTESSAEKKVKSQTSNSGPFSRDVTEIYTASTFLEDLYDENNRTFTIAAISKGTCLALTPVLGKLSLTRFPDKSLKDVLNNVEPFEVVTDEVDYEAIDFYVHDQRMFRNNPVRLQLIKNATDNDTLDNNNLGGYHVFRILESRFIQFFSIVNDEFCNQHVNERKTILSEK